MQLTLSANASDVSLVVSNDPEAGFDLSAKTIVPSSQIQVVGTTGTTVSLTVQLATPLKVTANSTNALDLEFDLNNPVFIVEHYPAGATSPTWAVNFSGPVRHHPHTDPSQILLRHHYGEVVSVSSDYTYITIDKAYPVSPITSPETATVSTTTTLPILADASNGTLLYNLDGSTPDTPSPITSFQSLASTLPGMYVRIAARYQANGTLVATRIFASSTFATVWANPEGHVLHVNTTTDVMHVTKEDGTATAILIGPNTTFYNQTSNTVLNPVAGSGQTFFKGSVNGLPNVARGFKVNVAVDPLSTTTPPTALSVEIDVARYNGAISDSGSTGFTYTRNFHMADGLGGKDDYTGTIDYISSSSSNTDQQGAAIDGFYWWDFTYPT